MLPIKNWRFPVFPLLLPPDVFLPFFSITLRTLSILLLGCTFTSPLRGGEDSFCRTSVQSFFPPRAPLRQPAYPATRHPHRPIPDLFSHTPTSPRRLWCGVPKLSIPQFSLFIFLLSPYLLHGTQGPLRIMIFVLTYPFLSFPAFPLARPIMTCPPLTSPLWHSRHPISTSFSPV